jgi:hypothetical protein
MPSRRGQPRNGTLGIERTTPPRRRVAGQRSNWRGASVYRIEAVGTGALSRSTGCRRRDRGVGGGPGGVRGSARRGRERGQEVTRGQGNLYSKAGLRARKADSGGGVDVFDLNLRETRRFSASRNFKVVGHSYLKGPWLTEFGQENGLGGGFNGVRVYDGIGYFGGYNSPPTVFGVVIADVSDPKNIEPLSFVPCNPGTRCPYLRVNNEEKILVMAHDENDLSTKEER